LAHRFWLQHGTKTPSSKIGRIETYKTMDVPSPLVAGVKINTESSARYNFFYTTHLRHGALPAGNTTAKIKNCNKFGLLYLTFGKGIFGTFVA
jgi:hypothetical protein